ncbi:hypothetical protein HNY73_001676 [Argiope bruennichi]|uniref:Uncharacterized protein n=1 Tax=Argiope bruennichi TaxID=94029 RepID=A0A8T0FR23_ARGBR|nr:hypothetical protein HNY73_001676 [Argiope bruennichi]
MPRSLDKHGAVTETTAGPLSIQVSCEWGHVVSGPGGAVGTTSAPMVRVQEIGQVGENYSLPFSARPLPPCRAPSPNCQSGADSTMNSGASAG